MAILTRSNFKEYYTGELVLSADVQKHFKYSIVEDNVKQLNTPIKNLISSAENTVIKTSWDLPFKPNRQVILDGEKFKIVRCAKLKTETNESAARMWKNNNIYWLIEAVK